MTDRSKDNPFYSNHVFNMEDLKRKALKITWTERFILLFRPMLVQLSEGRVFCYKTWGGRYYLIKDESLMPIIDQCYNDQKAKE